MRSWLAIIVTTLVLALLPRTASATSVVLDQCFVSSALGLVGTDLLNSGYSGERLGQAFTVGVPGTLGSDECSEFPGGGSTGGCFPGGGNTGGEYPGRGNAGDTTVSSVSAPDPGSTLLLLGIGLVGSRAWRKRWQ